MVKNICKVCGKSFNSPKSLQGHMTLHTKILKGKNTQSRTDSKSALKRELRALGLFPATTPGKCLYEKKIVKSLAMETADTLLQLSIGTICPSDSAENSKSNELKLRSKSSTSSPSHWQVVEGIFQHRCYKCNRGFDSGQALGGHMRVHWRGFDYNAIADYEKEFAFDLNEMPNIEKGVNASLVTRPDQCPDRRTNSHVKINLHRGILKN